MNEIPYLAVGNNEPIPSDLPKELKEVDEDSDD